MKNPTKAQAKEINSKLQKAYADSKPKNAAPVADLCQFGYARAVPWQYDAVREA